MDKQDDKVRVMQLMASVQTFCKDNYHIIIGIAGGLALVMLVRRS